MQRAEFLKALQQDLAVEEALTGNESLEAISWDSMSSLSFVALADSKLGIHVSGDQLAGCRTVNDLLKVVASGLN